MPLNAQRTKFLLLVILPALLTVLLLAFVAQRGATSPSRPISALLTFARARQVRAVAIDADGTLHATLRNGATFTSRKESGQVIAPLLADSGAVVTVNEVAAVSGGALLSLGVTVGMALLVLYVLRARMGGAMGSRLPVTPSAGAVEGTTANRITFNDVAGVEEAKDELVEIVEFLAAPERFRRIGARIPKGVLLSGPPGTGKTLLARAVAGEAGVPFFSISGSAFVEMYVGVGAARVRDLFARARKAAPAIVFIDELDAVGGRRSSGARGGNDEREHTLNQLLVEMDGFAGDSGVVVVGATNRADMLDAALLRPGRFDRRVTMSPPDRGGREAVLALHTTRVLMEDGVDLSALAGQTSGMSPADLANVVNEAALLAARQRRQRVSSRDLEAALLRVLAGPEMRSRVISAALKRVIAYHEVGHALVMKLLPHCDPVAKVQAIARGSALGITVSMPREDQYLLTESELRERMVGIMGGRAAEELFFGEVTTGAQQDIQQANAIARRMVGEFGMSPLGHICIGEGDMTSPELAASVDEATRTLVEDAYAHARRIVSRRRHALAAIADHLAEVETIDGADLDAWLDAYPAVDPEPVRIELAAVEPAA